MIDIILIALGGGILMGLTTAPFNMWFLAWFALVPLWIIIVKNNWRENILISLAWGAGYHGLALFWITGIHPMTWMGVPWLASFLIAILVWLFITFWGALLVIIWSFLFKILSHKNIFIRILLGISLWCILEYIWSNGDLWWTSLSFTQSPYNLYILHLSQISGPTTVTAIIILINGLIAESFLQKKYSKIFLLSALIILLSTHILGYLIYQKPIVTYSTDKIKIGIIQGNIPNTIKLYPEGWRKAVEGYTTGYKKLASEGVELILTPETALPFYWNDLVEGNDLFYQAIKKEKIPVLVGAFGKEGKSFTNSLFMINSNGETLNRYDKVKLVPLGEYIPFEKVLGKIIDRLSPLDSHLLRGNREQIIDTPLGQAIVGICYESAFSEHFRRQTARGGEFIITASNNAHYSDVMPAQHHGQDVMRAIENDRWIARATNTGYSAIVDPHGVTYWISQLNKYELHIDNIYRRNTQTLYVKYGDWLTIFFLVLTVILTTKILYS